MSRLLFAAARGARIQFWADPVKMWGTVGITFAGSAHELRIHPEDVHLAHGPISTALREMAETGNEPHTLYALMAMAAFEYERETDPFVFADERRHASMFALILAEALADEGL